MTLEPGDLVLTGTPAGVGTLSPGDVVEVEVVGVSRVQQPCHQRALVPHARRADSRRSPSTRSRRSRRRSASSLERGVDVIDLGAGDADLAPPPAALDAHRARPSREPAMSRYGFGLGLRAVPRSDQRVDAEALRRALRSAHRGRAAHRLEGRDLAPRLRVPRAGRRRDHPRAGLQRVPGRHAARERRAVSLRAAAAHRFPRRPRRDPATTCCDRTRILYLNYPNNPTAAIAPRRVPRARRARAAASATSCSCTTTRTPSSRSTATCRRASSRSTARATWRSSSTRCRRRTT